MSDPLACYLRISPVLPEVFAALQRERQRMVSERGGYDDAEDAIADALAIVLEELAKGFQLEDPLLRMRELVAKRSKSRSIASLEYLRDEKFVPESAMNQDWARTDFTESGRYGWRACPSCVGSGHSTPRLLCSRCGGNGWYESSGILGQTGALKRLVTEALWNEPKETKAIARLWITKRLTVQTIAEHIGRSENYVRTRTKKIEALLSRRFHQHGHRSEETQERSADDMIPCAYCGKPCRRGFATRSIAFCNLLHYHAYNGAAWAVDEMKKQSGLTG